MQTHVHLHIHTHTHPHTYIHKVLPTVYIVVIWLYLVIKKSY